MLYRKTFVVISISLFGLACARPRLSYEYRNVFSEKKSSQLLQELVTESDIDDSLRLVVKAGMLSYVQQLVEEYDADVNNIDEYGDTLLHHACSFGFVDVVTYLVEKCKMDVNTPGMCGDTPLHCAISNGHYHIVRYLINECGADISIKNDEGLDALGMMHEMQLLYQAIGACIQQATQRYIPVDSKLRGALSQDDADLDAMFDDLIDEMVENGAVSEDVNIKPLPQWKVYLMCIGDFVLHQYDSGKQALLTAWSSLVAKQVPEKKTQK